MKRTIEGIEISEGISKKTGKPYAIGTLHTTTPLAAPRDPNNIAKGKAGDKYSCDPILLRKIQHLSFPVVVDIETEEVLQYGVRQTIVTDIKPVSVNTKQA